MRLKRRLEAWLARPGRRPQPVDPKVGRLYVVAIAHLDSQWRWTVRDTIARHLPDTVRRNAAAFAHFPGYVLNLDGSVRYRWLAEYFPEAFAEVQRWVEAGRWHPAGCFVDAADVNLPAPESLIRQILYGNGYFESTFGIRNRDLFLPDCFGFGFALPSIAAHCGIRGFSSQKLAKGRSASPLPFALGRWQGPDGAQLVAALDPGGYGELLLCDLSRDADSMRAVEAQRLRSGVPVAMRYFGVGDIGGVPEAGSLRWLERSLESGGPLAVRTGASGRLFDELTEAEVARLPVHRGELLMGLHGTGCYTSQAAMKRWNRRNERLADAAERAAVAAHWLGAAPYPRARLNQAWERFLWHQFHDDLTGTSVPGAYRYSWNDEVLSLNQFAGVLTSAVGAVARALDTSGLGQPLVVFNPLSWERAELVEIGLPAAPGTEAGAWAVFGPDGELVPSQLGAGGARLVFRARVPSCGFAVYDLRRGAAGAESADDFGDAGELEVGADRLENQWLRATFDGDGNLAGLYDKATERELMAEPLRFELLPNWSPRFPAWEIRWEDVSAPPLEILGGPAQIRLLERGPFRGVLEVRRRCGRSRFVERWSLDAGQPLLRAECEIEWRSRGRLLKLAFPTALADPRATYDLGLGSIERAVNSPDLYEVPAQGWVDLSEAGGGGLAIASDCKQGWDRPRASILRLTLLHTPRVGRRFRHQGRQDLGHHRFTVGLLPHGGDWRAEIARRAETVAQPLSVFLVPRAAGGSAAVAGRRFSMLDLSAAGAGHSTSVAVRAVKLAEASDEVIVRLQELQGGGERVTVRAGAGIAAAREVTGAEQPNGAAQITAGALVATLGANQPRAFALRLEVAPEPVPAPRSLPLELPFDLDVASRNPDRVDGDFDGRGRSLPGELLPAELELGGVRFRFGSSEPGARNALACLGQRLTLPAGFQRLHLIAASSAGSARVRFHLAGQPVERDIAPWDGVVGRWGQPPRYDEVAWVGTHRHSRRGDEPYVFCYLYRYALDLPAPTTGALSSECELLLPDDPRLRIMAITLAADEGAAEPALPLYD